MEKQLLFKPGDKIERFKPSSGSSFGKMGEVYTFVKYKDASHLAVEELRGGAFNDYLGCSISAFRLVAQPKEYDPSQQPYTEDDI